MGKGEGRGMERKEEFIPQCSLAGDATGRKSVYGLKNVGVVFLSQAYSFSEKNSTSRGQLAATVITSCNRHNIAYCTKCVEIKRPNTKTAISQKCVNKILPVYSIRK